LEANATTVAGALDFDVLVSDDNLQAHLADLPLTLLEPFPIAERTAEEQQKLDWASKNLELQPFTSSTGVQNAASQAYANFFAVEITENSLDIRKYRIVFGKLQMMRNGRTIQKPTERLLRIMVKVTRSPRTTTRSPNARQPEYSLKICSTDNAYQMRRYGPLASSRKLCL